MQGLVLQPASFEEPASFEDTARREELYSLIKGGTPQRNGIPQDKTLKLLSVAPSFISLGAASGCVFASYLTAGGHLGEKLDSPLLLGLQALVVGCFNVVVLLSQEFLDESAERLFGVERAFCIRIVGGGLVSSLALFTVPLCTSLWTVLLAGAVLSYCALTQYSAAMQLCSVVVPGGGTLVSLGMSIGGLFPLLTTRMFGFQPGCSLRVSLLYFGAASFVGVLVTTIFMGAICINHIGMDKADQDAQASPEGGAPEGPEEHVRNAYKAISQAALVQDDAPAPWREANCGFASVGIFTCMAIGFTTVPLFTTAGAYAAQLLVLAKSFGDFLGRVLAVAHTTRCNSRGYTGHWVQYWAAGLILLRSVLCAVLVALLLSGRLTGVSAPMGCTVVVIFLLGTYGLAMLDLDSQMDAGGKARRKSVQRWNLIMMFAGQLLGIIAGILIRGWVKLHS